MHSRTPEPLFPYQELGAEWLAGHERKHLLLADEQGTGKSAQTTRAADLLGAQSVLIVCPSVARFNWENEIRKFSEYLRKTHVLVKFADRPVVGAVNICSYEYATENRDLLTSFAWDVMVTDEAHFANNPNAKRTQAILGKRGLIHSAKRTWLLTGTPIGNDWGELWVMLYVFGHTKLSYSGFLLRYTECEDDGRGGLKVLHGKQEMAQELKEMLAKFTLRRKKMDVLKDLPPISFDDHLVEASDIDFDCDPSLVGYVFPTDRRQEFWKRLNAEHDMIAHLLEYNGLGERGLDALAGVADTVPTLRRFLGLSKVKEIGDLIHGELTRNLYQKVVIFAIHQGVIEALRARLSKFHAVTLYGQTPPDKREKHIQNFQKSPKHRVFIANIKAAGTAINLTAAHQVVFAEQEWNPIHNAQAAMRCHRIGQTQPVSVRFMALRNSLDQRVAQILKRKAKDAAQILG